jgi:hypothetical protein
MPFLLTLLVRRAYVSRRTQPSQENAVATVLS